MQKKKKSLESVLFPVVLIGSTRLMLDRTKIDLNLDERGGRGKGEINYNKTN